jgi:prolyl-tRNA editing enzyme YbaK/EbsC (Cys-tRNA(Pro) deacylase)
LPQPPDDFDGETRLRAYLAQHGIAADLVTPGASMPTVPSAAAAVGVAEDQIIKSVLFVDREMSPILAIACGTGRIDAHLLAEASGRDKLILAKPDVVLSVTGYPAGGVAPVGYATPIPVVIDHHVMEQPIVYGGAGSETSLLRIEPRLIIELTGATIADIVRRPGE